MKLIKAGKEMEYININITVHELTNLIHITKYGNHLISGKLEAILTEARKDKQ